MKPPKEKALRLHPQSLKATLTNHNNITPFKSRVTMEKRHLHSIKHKSYSNIDILDILEEELKKEQPSLTKIKAAHYKLKQNTKRVLSMGEQYK